MIDQEGREKEGERKKIQKDRYREKVTRETRTRWRRERERLEERRRFQGYLWLMVADGDYNPLFLFQWSRPPSDTLNYSLANNPIKTDVKIGRCTIDAAQ